MENYDLGIAIDKIYSFIWNEFCDWYIEMVKSRLYDKENETRKAAQYTLNKVLCDSLKLLHPFMPFITEEIYTKLYHQDESIMISDWPEYDEKYNFEDEEKLIESLKEIITGIRNIRTNLNVHPSKKSTIIFVIDEKENLMKEMLEQSNQILQKLAFANNILVQSSKEGIPQNAMSILLNNIEVYIPFEELVDIQVERERLENEVKKLEAEVTRASKMLSNEGFISKAPESKIQEEKEKLSKYEDMLKATKERLESLK